jgi:hypothetical protein
MATRQARLEPMASRPAGQTRPEANNPAPATAAALNVEEEIRVRAYELFEQRGGEPGRELDDWLQAEAEVRARHGRSKAA